VRELPRLKIQIEEPRAQPESKDEWNEPDRDQGKAEGEKGDGHKVEVMSCKSPSKSARPYRSVISLIMKESDEGRK